LVDCQLPDCELPDCELPDCELPDCELPDCELVDRANQHRPPLSGVVGDACVALGDNPAGEAVGIHECRAKAAAAEIAREHKTQSKFLRWTATTMLLAEC